MLWLDEAAPAGDLGNCERGRAHDRAGGAWRRAGDWGKPETELIQRYARMGLVWGGSSADHVVRYSVAYDPEVMREALNELVTQAGVDLLFHVWGARALLEGSRIDGVAFESRAGRQAIAADVVIDATGDGHLLALRVVR